MESVNYAIVSYGKSNVTSPLGYWIDDFCDCDERCQKCGKKKKNRYTYPTVTYTTPTVKLGTGCCSKC